MYVTSFNVIRENDRVRHALGNGPTCDNMHLLGIPLTTAQKDILR